jgi:hypothetical protein
MDDENAGRFACWMGEPRVPPRGTDANSWLRGWDARDTEPMDAFDRACMEARRERAAETMRSGGARWSA